MKGWPEIRVASERLEGRRIVGGELYTQPFLHVVYITKVLPSHPTTYILPDPLNRIEFGTIGRQQDKGDVRWEAYLFRRMRRTVVKHQAIEGRGIRAGTFIEKDLHVGRVELGHNQEK